MTAHKNSLAILFTCISGRESLVDKLGKIEADYAIERCVRRIERIIIGLRGQIINNEGLETFASFLSADDAYHASVEIQFRVRDLPPVSGVSLAVRESIHYGETDEETGLPSKQTTNEASQIVKLTGESQILASHQALSAFSSVLCYSLCPIEERKFPEKDLTAKVRIYEILWQNPPQSISEKTFRTIISGIQTGPRPVADNTVSGYQYPASSAPAAYLHYCGVSYPFDDEKGFHTIGRDANCDITIKDRKASRNHARIEKRFDQFVLIDTSTNGTFVVFDDQPEILIRHREIILRNNCILCFGGMPDHKETERIAFELRHPL